MRILWVAIFILSSLSFSAFGQRYSIMQRGAEEGLRVPIVNDIEMDPTGMIWLATDGGGMVQFNGAEFISPEWSQRLPSPFVTVVFRDFENRFWLGTESGLALFDGHDLKVFDRLAKQKIVSVFSQEDEMIVATREGIFIARNDSFYAHPQLDAAEILACSKFKNGFAFTTPAGSFLLNNGSLSALPQKGVQRLIAIPNGLVLCTPDSAIVRKSDTTFAIAISGVRDALLTADGTLWLASQKLGLVRIFNKKVEIINASKGLTFQRTRCFFEHDNKVWIGSQQGLSFLSNPNEFVLDASQGLPDESVHAALEFNDRIYIGTASSISVFNQKTGAVQNFSQSDGLPGGIVLALAAHNGKVWAATEQGVGFISGDRFVQFSAANGFDPSFVFCLASTSKGLLVGTASGIFKIENDAATSIPFAQNLADGVVEIRQEQDEILLVGISGTAYKLSQNSIDELKNWHGLSIDSLRVFSIVSDQKWAALLTSVGQIFIWDGNKISQVAYGESGQSSIFKAAALHQNRLWFTTESGLEFLDLKKPYSQWRVRQSTPFATINQRDFNARSLRLSNQGNLYCGSNNGLLVLKNANQSFSPDFSVGIQQVNLFFQSQTNWSGFAEGVYGWSKLPQDLRLPYHQNYLSFTFNVPPNEAQDAQYFFRYKLEGQDLKWTVADGRREAFFTSISPGKFTFRVQAAYTPDFVNAREAIFHFRITTPFFKTWWFWTLIVLFFAVIVFFIVRYRIRQLNQKLALETALADSERKALRLQMNPHFVFNALDAISGFIFKNEPKTAVKYLGNFAKLMRLTLESSRETLVPLQNEIQLLKNYIDLEQLRFGGKFDYEISIENDIDPFDAMLPPMLLQPFVENAIKHGLKHRSAPNGMLNINFSAEENHIVCTIIDNGVGRAKSAELNKNKNKQSLATSITEERIDLISKSLGEKVSFAVTDLYFADGSASGTKVQIVFPQIGAFD